MGPIHRTGVLREVASAKERRSSRVWVASAVVGGGLPAEEKEAREAMMGMGW